MEEGKAATVSLETCVNVDDVERLAHKSLTTGAAAYYAAGAEDGNSLQENVEVQPLSTHAKI